MLLLKKVTHFEPNFFYPFLIFHSVFSEGFCCLCTYSMHIVIVLQPFRDYIISEYQCVLFVCASNIITTTPI